MSSPALEAASTVTEHSVDILVRATASEQKIALLGAIGCHDQSIADLRQKYMEICGYVPRSYFKGTLVDSLARLPGEVIVDVSDSEVLSPSSRVKLTDKGMEAAAVGGLLLENVSAASGNVSLAHIYARPDNRGINPNERLELSGQWRIFKLLQSLIEEPKSPGDFGDIFEAHGAPLTRTGIMKIVRRHAKLKMITHVGMNKRSKLWGLTERGYEIAEPLITAVFAVASGDQETTATGISLISEHTRSGNYRARRMPALIERAKRAYGISNTRLEEINKLLERVAQDRDGKAEISTADLTSIIGSDVTHTQLMRVYEELPFSNIRSVRSRAAGHEGNIWVVEASTPSRHYRALGQSRN